MEYLETQVGKAGAKLKVWWIHFQSFLDLSSIIIRMNKKKDSMSQGDLMVLCFDKFGDDQPEWRIS